ncbi:hypothetical protein DOTSEDRAFT_62083 [Dothistroma septosporum NZE10]|uniref:Uncharacterized protein n=1 Tax=Dothistroma septosporum (strain NZE10 / CBS 128990) TaxID=675120 RepID=N1PQ77_DOTSN|nr:hypothetical protein DOTSEDRAFT_62083 [Dothistroma septosporum NZE10]
MSVTSNGDYTASVLAEEKLKQTSKSSRTLVPDESSSVDNINDFKHLLDSVFATSSAAGLSAPHRVAAWNTLCCLIDQSLVSVCPDLQRPEYVSQVWIRAFDLYLKHAQSAKPKSAKQLLGTLTNVLRSRPEAELLTLRQTALSRLIDCLTDYQAPHAAKASTQLLGQLLHKDIVTLREVLDVPNSGNNVGESTNTNVDYFQHLLEILLRWLSKGDFGSSIAQLVAILLDKYHQAGAFVAGERRSEEQECPVWTAPLQDTLVEGSVGIDDLRAHILPVLFKCSFDDFVSFLHIQGFWSNDTAKVLTRSEAQNDLLFASLQTGKELGLIVETDKDDFSHSVQPIQVPVRWLGHLLRRKSRSARLTGLSLLTTSHSATRPFSSKALTQIRRALQSMFADVDADFRSGVFSAFQRLIDRLRAITAVLFRQKHAGEKAQGNKDVAANVHLSTSLDIHRDFLRWTLRFVTWELRPTASYQRHISALKCLCILVRSGVDSSIPSHVWSRTALGESRWPFSTTVLTKAVQRLLLDLAMDPFDDVRQAATTILDMHAPDPLFLDRAMCRAESDMLRTGRADHADGVARIHALRSTGGREGPLESNKVQWCKVSIAIDLVGQLEQMLGIARRSLADAVSEYPLHGVLTSLRYVLGRNEPALAQLRGQLAQLLQDLWTVVKPVLCNDAPEGYIPEEQEGSSDSTKETLSYCWRALKEASLLLSALVSAQGFGDGIIDQTLIERLSTLCFIQLAELRHRGAFSTVALSWTTCCIQCRDMKTSSGGRLLDTWYYKVLDMLRGNVTINTRRSAGLPSLLCGLLIADSSQSLLSRAVADLETISRQEVDLAAAEEGSLAQVHAMNCLKDILKNSKLGEQSEPHIAAAFQLAADSLLSGVWAIRNCGLMLFRAVVDRILKTDQSHFDDDLQLGRHISAEQYPVLLDTIVGLLPRPDHATTVAKPRDEGVFAALQLLQHTRVPVERTSEIKEAIRTLISSASWHMRDKAARTLATVMCNQSIISAVAEAVTWLSDNLAHGTLLTAKYVIRIAALRHERSVPRAAQTQADPMPGLLPVCQAIIPQCCAWAQPRASDHPVTRAAFIDLVRELSHILLLSYGIRKGEEQTVHRPILNLWSSEHFPEPTVTVLIPMLFAECLGDTSSAVLRQAIARFFAQQVSLHSLDEESAKVYACKHFLQAFKEHETIIARSNTPFLRELCYSLLRQPFDIELKCEALEMLLYLSIKTQDGSSLDSEPFFVQSRDHLFLLDCNQRYTDLYLEHRAVQLDQKYGNGCSESGNVEIVRWMKDCASAVSGNGTHTREAAAKALERVRSLWAVLYSVPGLYESLLSISLTVYDLLNDDNEEIRLLAAGITQRILSVEHLKSRGELEPISASQELLAFCRKHWNTSQRLAREALQRAFEWFEAGPSPVSDHLQSAYRAGTALFAEEKQNLYIDDAKEVRAWTQVINGLAPHALSGQSIVTLTRWVETSLDALLMYAEDHPDGALGWSSDADTFTIGLRVVYGTEVLLRLSRHGRRLPTKASHLRRRLHECDLAFEGSEVNCLWRWEIQRVLHDSVLHKARKKKGHTQPANFNSLRGGDR